MANGTVSFTSSDMTMNNNAFNYDVNCGTYSLPDGCTYVRHKATKSNTGTWYLSWVTPQSFTTNKWDQWSTGGTSEITNSGHVSIRVKNSTGGRATSNFTVTVEFSYPSRSITVSAGTGGSASANVSSATATESVTLTATPSTGYSFSKWTTTGGTLANAYSSSTTLTMPNSNVTVTASFTINSYTLTTAVSPSGYGSVTAGGSMEYGATKSLTATAGTGRYFSSWSKTAGTLSSTTSNPTTFTMGAEAATVTANFGTNNYTLTVSKGTGISSVSGGGSKAYASSNAISATASTGYTFKNWTSNNGGTFANANSASTNFTMPAGNVTVTANATVNSYTLTVSKGTGISSVSGGGSKNYGSSNAISATVSTGYTFKNWTSNNGGSFANANSSSTNFTMPAGNVTVTANATINSYTLTTKVSPSGGGSVTAGGSLNYNSTKRLTATASTGYSFSSWSKTAGTLSSTTSNPTTFTMGTSAATVTANFTHIQYTLTTASSPAAGGSTSGGGKKYYNDSCSISATANTGYTFSKWTTTGGTLANANAASTTLTMPNANATVTASFTHIQYTLTLGVSPSGGGTVSGGGTKYYADSCSISASPSTGYQFVNWTTSSGGTIASSTSASTTYTMPNSNATVTANFSKINYTVTATGGTGGSLTASVSTAQYGDTVTLTPTANTGYEFVNYTVSPAVTITNNQFSMPASNISITANFQKITYAITCASDPVGAGTVSANPSSAQMDDTVTLGESASTGYMFDHWSSSPNVTITNNQFTMPASAVTVTAHYIVSASSCELDKSAYIGGDTAVLSINLADPTYTHRYKLSFGTNMETEWVSIAAGVDTVNIYIPVEWCMYMGAGANNGTLTLETYDNGSLLGDYQITGLSYSALDSTIPSLSVWRCDSNHNPVIDGEYVGYSAVVPQSITTYSVNHDQEPLSVNNNHDVILTMTYGSETFNIVHDIPKVISVKKLLG